MDLELIIPLVLLLTFGVNYLHWLSNGRKKLVYFPPSTILGLLFTVWMIASVIGSVAFLMGWLSLRAFFAVAFGFAIMQEVYSVWRRVISNREKF